MRGIIIVLSGRIASGKSTLAKKVYELMPKSTAIYSASAYLKRLTNDHSRSSLQEIGHDRDDRYPNWVNDVIVNSMRWVTVLDCIRNVPQIAIIRKMNPNHRVIHIHMDIPLDVTSRRREETVEAILDVSESEENLRYLRNVADMVLYPHEVAGWAERQVKSMIDHVPRIDAIIGGQYGSEGKGHIVSYLCGEYDVVIRSGGPNAGHKVKFGEDIFTFFHIPSCCLHNPQAIAYIAPSALIRPDKIVKEIADLEKLLGHKPRLGIHPDAFIIEREDIDYESGTLKGDIGSTAQGVGAALSRRVLRKKGYRTAKDIPELSKYLLAPGFAVDHLTDGRRVLIEGTQGFGLSMYHGDYPYTTSRDTGVASLLSELGIPPSSLGQVWGVFRTYPIRVQSPEGGTSGPMRSETSLEAIHEHSKIPLDELQTTETTSTTFRKRRIAEFDLGQFARTMRMNGITHVACTFMDYFGVENRDAKHISDLNGESKGFISKLGIRPALVSCGFDHKFIIDNRG